MNVGQSFNKRYSGQESKSRLNARACRAGSVAAQGKISVGAPKDETSSAVVVGRWGLFVFLMVVAW
jgi:hypothetical protein